MVCKCGKEHDGSFGSGKFCSRVCANSREFSEDAKRKKSDKQKAYIADHPESMKALNAKGLAPETRRKAHVTMMQNLKARPFEELGIQKKKLRVIQEQNGKCDLCGISQEWNGKFLAFELDHISGDRTDESRGNLRAICPNCHSQTPTYKTKNATRKVTDEELLEAIESSASMFEAFRKLGMNPHGTHYQRAMKLKQKNSQ